MKKNIPAKMFQWLLTHGFISVLTIIGPLTIQLHAQFGNEEKPELYGTHYCVPTFQNDPKGIPLLDKAENETGFRLDSTDWCKAAIEGTVIIEKKGTFTVLNYAGRSETQQFDCRKCQRYRNYKGYEATGKVLWTQSSGYGNGVRNYKLVPFKTIAVDPSVIPYGSVVYIKAADGDQYIENGVEKTHDGYFFAGDTGSQIEGGHVDFFIGNCDNSGMEILDLPCDVGFYGTIIKDPEVIKRLEQMHR